MLLKFELKSGKYMSPFTLEVIFLALTDVWVLIRLVFAVSEAITHTFRCYQFKIAFTVAKLRFITPIRAIFVTITEWWFVNTATIIAAQLVQFALCCKNLIISRIPTMLILPTRLMNTFMLIHNIISHRTQRLLGWNKEYGKNICIQNLVWEPGSEDYSANIAKVEGKY